MEKPKRRPQPPRFTFTNLLRALIVVTLMLTMANQFAQLLAFLRPQPVILVSAPPAPSEVVMLEVEQAPAGPRLCTETDLDLGLLRGNFDLDCQGPIRITQTKTIRFNTVIGLPGNSPLIIDGRNNLYEMFVVEDGATLVLENVRIINSRRIGLHIAPGGNVSAMDCAFSGHGNPIDDGAAIWNAGGQLYVRACVFEDNHSYDDGAAIFNWYDGTIEVQDSLFRNNSVGVSGNGTGAAISNYGHATIVASEFSHNRAINSSGATIINHAGEMMLDLSLLQHNMAGHSGAALMNLAGAYVHVRETRFLHNQAPVGAHIYNFGEMTLEASTLSEVPHGCFSIGVFIALDTPCDAHN